MRVVFCLHEWLCTMCIYCSEEPEESIRFPRTGVTDTSSLQNGCWTSKPGSLEEQPELLGTEPSLQLHKQIVLKRSQT